MKDAAAILMGIANAISLLIHCIWEKQRIKRLHDHIERVTKVERD